MNLLPYVNPIIFLSVAVKNSTSSLPGYKEVRDYWFNIAYTRTHVYIHYIHVINATY